MRPFRFAPAALLPLLVLIVCATSAVAQDSPASVTVLSIESATASDLAEEMYGAVRTQIEFHQDFMLSDVPPQPLDDLLLAVGCAELTLDCSLLIREIVQSDMLVWGTLEVEGARATLRLVLWDLESAQEARSRSHIVEGQPSLFAEHKAVIGRSLFYGDIGELSVTASVGGAEIFVDGRSVGPAPAEVAALPLGIHVVRAEAPGYDAAERVVVVDIDGAAVDLTLREILVERERREVSLDPTVFSYAMIGAGGALLATGVGFGIAERSTQREFDDVTAEDELDRERAEELRDRGQRQATLATALTISGGVVLAGGVVWRVLAGRGGDAPAEEADDPFALRVHPVAGVGHVGMGAHLRF